MAMPAEITLPSRVRTRFLPDGSYSFEDSLTITGELPARIITGRAWLLELYDVECGELIFLRDGSVVRVPARSFAAFFPPFTIARLQFRNVRGRVFGIASATALPPQSADVPIVFETAYHALGSRSEMLQLLRTARDAWRVPAYPNASALSQRAKRLIDRNHLAKRMIAGVAAQLGVSAAHLSRQFRRDFELSPREYLHQLRIADAPLMLATGDAIASVSRDCGYKDLTRFYTQFRKATKTSPGMCRTLVKPERK